VNDLILAGTNQSEIQNVKQQLHDAFKIKDLKNLKYFLGLEVARSHTRITLSQRKYKLDLLLDCGLLAAQPALTPMIRNLQLHQANCKTYSNPNGYRKLRQTHISNNHQIRH